MKQVQPVAAMFLALAFSVWLGRVDLHTDDTGILVGLIGCGGLFAALVEPRRPWVWGLIVPSGVIAVELWTHPGPGTLAIAALTTAVASVGAYTGSFVRPAPH
jgi:hypothetical protein